MVCLTISFHSLAMTNVDPQEINQFDKIAHQWWDPQGPCKPLHELNPLRLSFIQSACPLIDCPILDIGCGGGILTETLSQFSSQVVGIDCSTKALQVAKSHAQMLNPPRYELASAETFAQHHAQQFTLITCMELLEHVPDPASLIQACATLLKPNGHLFFSTLNRTPQSFLQAIIGAEYLLKWLPKGTHDYQRFIRPSELAQWGKLASLTLKQIKGISYRLSSQTFYLSNNVSVNYLMYFCKE